MVWIPNVAHQLLFLVVPSVCLLISAPEACPIAFSAGMQLCLVGVVPWLAVVLFCFSSLVPRGGGGILFALGTNLMFYCGDL